MSVNLVPLLLTGVLLNPPAPKGGPTSSSADVSVPRPRTHDDRTGRVLPDHLITYQKRSVLSRNFPPRTKTPDTWRRPMARADGAIAGEVAMSSPVTAQRRSPEEARTRARGRVRRQSGAQGGTDQLSAAPS